MRSSIIVAIVLILCSCFTGTVLWVCQPKNKKRIVYGIMGISIVSICFMAGTMVTIHSHEMPIIEAVLRVANYGAVGWMSMIFLSILPLAVLGLIGFLVNRHADKMDTAVGEGRRKWMTAATIVPVFNFGVSTGLAYTGDKNLWVHEMTLRFHDLPEELEGYTIGQISDSHIGPFFSLTDLHEVMQILSQKSVKRVVITGDFIDDISLVDATMKYMKEVSRSVEDGVQYIFGNHEYYRNLRYIEEALVNSGMTVLRNSHIQLVEGPRPVYLAGVDFPFHRESLHADMKDMLDKALFGIPNNAFTILLAHHPDFIGEAFKRGIPLTLAGHSHGGQINVGKKSVIPLEYTYWKGLYKATDKEAYGYVSNGTGAWLPIRYACPREVTIITLQRGQDNNAYNVYK